MALGRWTELSTVYSLAGIGASVAIIAALFVAWRQLRAFGSQTQTAIDHHFQRIDQDRLAAERNIAAAKETNRLRATLDLLMEIQTNPTWLRTRKKFVSLRDGAQGLEQYALRSGDEALLIRQQLNQYELIAVAIRKGVIDRAMYKRFYRGTFIRDHMKARNFIQRERDGQPPRHPANPRFWIEFEGLAKEFESEPVEKD